MIRGCATLCDRRVRSVERRVRSVRLTVDAQLPLEDRAVAVQSERTCGRRMAIGRGAARPVSSTGVSGRPKKCPVKGTMALLVEGLINSPLAGLGR
jgi:hypothetical protein